MNTEMLNQLKIRIDSPANTVADFIALLLDKTKKAERDALKATSPATYYGLLLMVFQEQHGLQLSSIAEAVAMNLDGFAAIKKVVGNYPVIQVDTDKSAIEAFNTFLATYTPKAQQELRVLKNGDTALDGLGVLEKIFNKRYAGDLQLFTDHCMGAWKANLEPGSPNPGSIPKAMGAAKVGGLLYILHKLATDYSIRKLTEEQLKKIECFCDINIIETVTINKAADDLAKKLQQSIVPEPVSMLPPARPADPVVLPAPVSMTPAKTYDYDEDIDEAGMAAKQQAEVPEATDEEIDEKVEEVFEQLHATDVQEQQPNTEAGLEYYLGEMLLNSVRPESPIIRGRLIGLMTLAIEQLK
jgi:hypothetical protein